MTEANGERWYVAQMRPLENWLLVLEHFVRAGFEGYVPVERRRMFQAGVAIYVEAPLFRSYCLAKLDGTNKYQADRINHIPGIKHLLPMHSELPTALPLDFVDELKARPAVKDVEETVKRFQGNDLVRIISGPFAGKEGVVLSSTLSNTWLRNQILGKVRVATSNVARA